VTYTVYIIGAGVNQVLEHHWYNGVSPPMIKNFFQVASKIPLLRDYGEQMKVVYDYIYKFWKKNESELAKTPFDLEDCFTMIELGLYNALKSGNTQSMANLQTIQFRLKMFLAEVLNQFEIAASTSQIMKRFGVRLNEQKPVIISFNYDTFLEIALESSSGFSDTKFPSEALEKGMHGKFGLPQSEGSHISDEKVDYSQYNWTRRLGYGMEFDVVRLAKSGIREYVPGKRFYSRPTNKLYSWYILKLHGSLNWFRYLPIRSKLTVPGQQESILA